MALLSECVGAKGFEADTYFGDGPSRCAAHSGARKHAISSGFGRTVHLAIFRTPKQGPERAAVCGAEEAASTENPYLMEARTNAVHTIAFGPLLRAYAAHKKLPNIKRFARQTKAFRDFARTLHAQRSAVTDTQLAMARGAMRRHHCLWTTPPENASRLDVPEEMLSAIFQFLVADLSVAALSLASLPELEMPNRSLVRRMIVIPATAQMPEF